MVDAGGLSFPETSTPKEKEANGLRARFLTRALGTMGAPFVAGLAETDVAADGTVSPRRIAIRSFRPPPRSSRPPTWRLWAESASACWRRRSGARRSGGGEERGCDRRREARGRTSAKSGRRGRDRAGADRTHRRASAGARSAARLRRARAAGRQGPSAGRGGDGRYLVAPADELQQVGRLDITLRAPARPLVDAGSPAELEARRAELDQAAARLDADLKQWTAAGGGDRHFWRPSAPSATSSRPIAKRSGAPWQPPAGSYFSNRLIPLRRSVPRDAKLAAEMRKLDGQIASVNLRNAPPPAPREPGRAYFVGDAKCTSCHKSAMAFWKHTVHASAWQTLVVGGKQNDFKCVGCHVTGYGEVGGTSLGHTERLRNVQCEVCHGPGSAHVAGEGLEEPLGRLRRATPASTCTTCHTNSTPTPSSTRPTCATSSVPAMAAPRAPSSATAPRATPSRTARAWPRPQAAREASPSM